MNRNFELHGHRGCRGLLPENSIAAFQKAIDLGVDAIELDLVVSAGNTLIVTHDPWIDSLLTKPLDGEEITKESHNIFRLSDKQIEKYKTGEMPHPNFPEQVQKRSAIPTFQEMVDIIGRSDDWFYNIEVKSEEGWYNEYQPDVHTYARLVFDFITENEIEKHCMVQCFDPKLLNAFYELSQDIPLGFLTENVTAHIEILEQLTFKPKYYNPNFEMVTPQLVDELHARSIIIVPWTVNEVSDMKRLLEMGVDGLITDYPDRAKQLV